MLAKPNELIGVGDRAQARKAQLVQGDRRDLEANAPCDGRLTRRVRSDTGLDDIAHDDGVNIGRRNASAAQGLANGNAAEI